MVLTYLLSHTLVRLVRSEGMSVEKLHIQGVTQKNVNKFGKALLGSEVGLISKLFLNYK